MIGLHIKFTDGISALSSKLNKATVSVLSRLGITASLFYSGAAFADDDDDNGGAPSAEGFADIDSFLGVIVDWMGTAAILVVTIAIMWCGYIMLFSRGNTSQIPYILGGGVLIGSAPTLVNLFGIG